MKYLIVFATIIVGFYFYSQTFTIKDPQTVAEVDRFLESKVLYMDSSKYATKKVVIKPDGYLKYLVTIVYTGVDNGSARKVGFEKSYRLSKIPRGERNDYELIADVPGVVTCSEGKIYFGAKKGQCR